MGIVVYPYSTTEKISLQLFLSCVIRERWSHWFSAAAKEQRVSRREGRCETNRKKRAYNLVW